MKISQTIGESRLQNNVYNCDKEVSEMAYEKREVTLVGYALIPIHNFKDKRKKSRRARQITRTPPLSANLTAGPPSTRSDSKCKGARDAKKCKGEKYKEMHRKALQ